MIRWMSGGESHGRCITVLIDGIPSGLRIDRDFINLELKRRQKGYGRGQRMSIERDKIRILSGIRDGITLGTPITMSIKNRDFENWNKIMDVMNIQKEEKITSPRPGHADLPGILKYNFKDIRNVLERASARETAARVAAGALFKMLLKQFNIKFYSHTLEIGGVAIRKRQLDINEIEKTPLRCLDPEKEKEMMLAIDRAKEEGDSLGGISEVVATGVPPGLGSYSGYDRRIDAEIGKVMISIPSIKGVEIGSAFDNSRKKGSLVHDEIFYSEKRGYYRNTNRAGGTEGGITNGENLIVRLAVKPIPTLKKPLHSVDIETKEERKAQKERADTCIVPAAGVIGESMLASVVANFFLRKFGGDNMKDIETNYHNYMKRIKK